MRHRFRLWIFVGPGSTIHHRDDPQDLEDGRLATTYIIDGYNVMRSLLPAAEIGGDLARARRSLEAKLRAFRAGSPAVRIVLVYDGDRGAPAQPPEDPELEILFARPPQEADDVVIALSRRLEGEPGVSVVTSDFTDIWRRVSGLRLRRLTAREFAGLVARRLGRPASRGPASAEKPAGVSPQEAEDWAREFGFGAGAARRRRAGKR